jgi:ketosteroid isomerase-like protein
MSAFDRLRPVSSRLDCNPLAGGSSPEFKGGSQEERSMLKRRFLALLVLGVACASGQVEAASPIDAKIRSEVAEIIAGINAKDIDRATKYDAPDLVSMESGRGPSTGAKADRGGLLMAFKYAPSWHLTMIDETVDVAEAGDTAVYRGTYEEDSMRDGVPFTHTGNYVAGFRHDPDGIWRVHWSVIAWQTPSHKK